MSSEISPFPISIEQCELDRLRQKLADVRWPEKETPDDWSQGVPLVFMRRVHDHWLTKYDWRPCEARINGFGSYATELDGLQFHFLHVRSPHKHAKPLILTHGWPGSILEFYKAIPQLIDPTAHGGAEADAFHVIVPSLPGYGFSERPSRTGWNVRRIARAWTVLMQRLGYDSYLAQGGDWGSSVSLEIGRTDPEHCRAVHVNLIQASPDEAARANLTEKEVAALARLKEYNDSGAGYSHQQSTRPQTLGYGLVDSPIGQAAWIIEKFWAWTDCQGDPESILTLDELLDNVMMYWLTGTGASSARLYWESLKMTASDEVSTPVGFSAFPKEILAPSRRWAERRFKNIIYWNEVAKGGHFAAFEQPDLFVSELRACFQSISL